MAIAKIAVSLPASLLTRVDRLAKKSGLSRSAFVRQAVERTLESSAGGEVLRRAQAVYAEIAEEDRALAEKFLPLVAETLPAPSKRRGG